MNVQVLGPWLDPVQKIEERIVRQLGRIHRNNIARTVIVSHSTHHALHKVDEVRESLDDGIDWRVLTPDAWEHYGFHCTRLYVAHTLFGSEDILRMMGYLGSHRTARLVVRSDDDFVVVEDWDL